MSLELALDSIQRGNDQRPPDWEAREDALDIQQSWIVEAPAGSGKTGLLIQRYLKLLATVTQPEEVLALTFTRKATVEMRERVLAALEEATAEEPLPADASPFARLTRALAQDVLRQEKAQGWRLREQSYRLNIRTIDSFAGELAAVAPLLSGGLGKTKPVENAGDLYARAARTVLLRLGGEDASLNDAIRTTLLHRDADLSECERLLAEMLGTREQWGELLPLAHEVLDDALLDRTVLPRLHEALRSAVCSGLTELHARFPEAALQDLAEIARELAHAEGHKELPNPYRPCATREGPPGTDAADLDHWLLIARLLLTGNGWRKAFHAHLLGAEPSKASKARLKQISEQLSGDDDLRTLLEAVRCLPPAEYPVDQWRVAKALFRLLGAAVAELRRIFRREGVCDFAEQALAAKAALDAARPSAGPELAGGLRLHHLLVDEMQDTSSSQYELLEGITAGWSGTEKTVFLVGDPKQSIYLFRQARVERFLRGMATGRFGSLDLGRLQLTANFRSGAALVDEFNDAFTRIFPRGRTGVDAVLYTPADAVVPAEAGEGSFWHTEALPVLADPVWRTSLRRHTDRNEAEEIASLVSDWRARPLPAGRTRPWQIAVLTRARTHIANVLQALAEASIPFRAVELEPLAERQEVMDAIALTRALVHPGDRTAWLAVLHAPWCGLSLGDLHVLAAGDRGEQRHEALPLHLRERAAALDGHAQRRLYRSLDVLEEALRQRGRGRLAAWVERTWHSLGGDLCLSPLEQENVRSFWALLDTMTEPVSQASLTRQMERLYAEPSQHPDAIDVLTIHKAKGLEWDLVLIPGLHKMGGRTKYPLLDWAELGTQSSDGRSEVLLAPIGSKGETSGSLNNYIRQLRQQREDAELKRLFYVAATRARQALHVFASPVAKKDGEVQPRRGALLRAAWPAAADFFAKETSPAFFGFDNELDQPEGTTLAASADNTAERVKRRSRIKRLPLSVDPRTLLRAKKQVQLGFAPGTVVRSPEFARPEGSFAARHFGNAVHAFAERLAHGISASASLFPEQAFARAQAELPAWTPAVSTYLRAGGLRSDEVSALTQKTIAALTRMLSDAEGRWILSPHPGAVSEGALVTPVNREKTAQSRLRLDRSFLAGAAPLSHGEDTLWIVDLKTAEPAGRDIEGFLHLEQVRYAPQLRRYAEARILTLPAGTPVMLALYYPLLGRLVSWAYKVEA